MHRWNPKRVRTILVAVSTVVLGAAATQALASPYTEPQAALFCNLTQRQACMADCADEGKSFVSCSVSGGSVNCVCS